jgi:hypothetical protein
VAVCGDRFFELDKMLNNLDGIRVVTQILWSTSTGQNQRIKSRWIHLVQSKISLDPIAELFRVSVEPWLKVVYHGLEHSLFGRSDRNVPAFFLKPKLGIENLQRFAGVAAHDQDSHGFAIGLGSRLEPSCTHIGRIVVNAMVGKSHS